MDEGKFAIVCTEDVRSEFTLQTGRSLALIYANRVDQLKSYIDLDLSFADTSIGQHVC